MEYFNKIYFHNNMIMKVYKCSKNCVYANTFKIDYVKNYNFIDVMLKYYTSDICNKFNNILLMPDESLTHYTNNIDDKNNFKIRKINFVNAILINDINKVYLHNKELIIYKNINEQMNISHYELNYLIRAHMNLFINEIIIKTCSIERKQILLFFFNKLFVDDEYKFKSHILLLGYNKIFKVLQLEASTTKIIIMSSNNKECSICLMNDKKTSTDFYNCSHSICLECFNNRKVNYCPLCKKLLFKNYFSKETNTIISPLCQTYL